MTAYDVRFRSMAARMLAPIASGGKGQAVTLTPPSSGGTFNAATDATTGATPAQTHSGSGIEEAYSAYSVASGMVAAGDTKFLLSPLKADGSVMPRPVADSWTLTKADGSVCTIKRVEPIQPAGLGIVYELQLRGVG